MDKNFLSLDMELLSKNLLRAREASGKSIKEISAIVGIPSSRLRNYEKGAYVPSLSELELLSFLYRIPLLVLIGKIDIDDFIHEPDEVQTQQLLEIRQRLISTRIQIAREKKELTYNKLSELTNIPSSKIKRYESGKMPIPLDELIELCQILELDFSEIEDISSPIGKWQANQLKMHNLQQLPEETLSFIEKPENKKFIETAKFIANIGEEKLNLLAKSMLEIVDSTPSYDDHIQE